VNVDVLPTGRAGIPLQSGRRDGGQPGDCHSAGGGLDHAPMEAAAVDLEVTVGFDSAH
jgi:hypothetical protein